MTDSADTDSADKASLRRVARDIRARIAADAAAADKAAEDACERILLTLADRLGADPRPCLAFYWPVRGEIDVRMAALRVSMSGIQCALPVIRTENAPLEFRLWRPGEPLIPGKFGIDAPGPDAPAVRPDIVIVPLLAFDRAGNRLGQGAGYYDRTLQALRAQGEVLAVGAGYDAQEMASLPRAPCDQTLDWMITESRAIDCRQC